MIFSQRLALKYEIPLVVVFCLSKSYMRYSRRHFDFMIRGLDSVSTSLKALKIPMHVLLGDPTPNILKFVKNNNVSAVIADFLPLDPYKSWLEDLKQEIPEDVSLCQVDAHNIVPAWIASPKREYAARTIRPKIHQHLDEFLTEFPPIIPHEPNKSLSFPDFEISKYIKFVEDAADVKPITWAVPGPDQGLLELEKFVSERLGTFADTRNDAANDLTSNLSPWFHFGHLSTQRTILRAIEFKNKYKKHVEIFIEEAVVRRELSENYCYYTEEPESPSSAPNWAVQTLKKHLKDERPYVYTLEELENAETHDHIWNAAQKQLTGKGKMSNYLRMYWAKKILEWSADPETALKNSLILNDKYSIDGNDCNGVVGCMWAVYGLHDRPWRERPIFGIVRYMSEVGCNRHFNIEEYVEKHIKAE
ncbi:Deoxyribodipyrimidine photo-lyase [Thelohanellus kitauei]|uniref:Deoxyribodipyrimidine photo-lyase n=1 Tax=Thelohanellus kitauei TaxID=669202 RepID=A0A0C2N5U0_THEKT|nr:Deoxyribodipyrimidine photo-lyase [Thelohanellus kitauei]